MLSPQIYTKSETGHEEGRRVSQGVGYGVSYEVGPGVRHEVIRFGHAVTHGMYRMGS